MEEGGQLVLQERVKPPEKVPVATHPRFLYFNKLPRFGQNEIPAAPSLISSVPLSTGTQSAHGALAQALWNQRGGWGD